MPPIRLPSPVIGEGNLLEDQQGMLWVTTRPGLFRVDPETGTVLNHFASDPYDFGSLSSPDLLAIVEDATGTIWGGTGQGLNRLDRSTGTFTRYRGKDLSSLGVDFVEVLYEDRQGILWVGLFGLGGLSRYDRDTDRFTTVLEDLSIIALYEDTQGRFWVGTEGFGLHLLDRATGAVTTTFTVADGLIHNRVERIVEDDQGYLWIATPGGLSQFDPEQRGFINFTEDDGLPTTITGTFLKSRNGTLLLGGDQGITVISPDQIPVVTDPPQVVLTGLQVIDTPLQDGWLLASSVELAHDQNDLTFSYVGLHFAEPEKNRYAYQLEGYDEAWREVGAERMARYTSLDPGDYTFRVKASNSGGVWNEEGTSVQIAILPPWWQTTWAYLLYGLFLIGMVVTVDRLQRRRLIAQEREKAQARELEQAREIERAYHELRVTKDRLVQQEKMASLGALTAGIAHEIKNPLNFVNNFAELNEELADEAIEGLERGEEKAELLAILQDLKQNAQVINQHGKRADGIVHAMMQHASGGTGQREPTDLNALVSEHIDLAYHGKRAQIPDLQVEIERDLSDDAGTVEIVPQEIGRVLLNLLGNAFDAVHEKADAGSGGRGDTETYTPIVTVSTRRVENSIEIPVSDNGPGIPTALSEKIFESFFTTKPTGSGTGLGLSLSYDIVTQGHGGTLTVEIEEGKGATFIVTLPVNATDTASNS